MNKNTEMQGFWDELANDGSWTAHYEGQPDLRTYNFYTRRSAVLDLLRGDEDFPRILDIGCGSGDYGEVAERHSGRYYGIDYAPEMIVKAVERHRGNSGSSRFLAGSGSTLPYRDDSFDLVIAMGYIEYFEDPDVTLDEIRRVLRHGGSLVMQSYKQDLMSRLDDVLFQPILRLIGKARPKPPLPDSWVDKQYSRAELDALLLRHGFVCESATYNNFYTLPGVLRLRYPRAYIRSSEAVTKWCPQLAGFLATNYIGKYILEKDRASVPAQQSPLAEKSAEPDEVSTTV